MKVKNVEDSSSPFTPSPAEPPSALGVSPPSRNSTRIAFRFQISNFKFPGCESPENQQPKPRGYGTTSHSSNFSDESRDWLRRELKWYAAPGSAALFRSGCICSSRFFQKRMCIFCAHGRLCKQNESTNIDMRSTQGYTCSGVVLYFFTFPRGQLL